MTTASPNSVLAEVQNRDRLRDQFETAWDEPARPKIEDYLGAVVELERPALLRELLGLELELRRESGEQPSCHEYELRFPEYVALVQAVFREGALPPERIDRYQVRRRLGGGGFGEVYLCYDEKMERTVAIKVPRRDRLGSVDAMAAFLREARNVARLKHSGIVTLHHYGEADGNCYLVYEFIEGSSLADRLRQGPMPQDQGARIMAQVADALHYAHGENVFHRDIKPANVLLDRQGQPYLTDFGLAVREEELPRERGRRSGTYPYMSPEQVRGEGHRIDGRTDIYSLGVVLYELLCARRPFVGSKFEVFDQILNREPRPPRQINGSLSPELERICLKAMAKQMNARYLTAGDVAEDLRLAIAPPPPSLLSGTETVDLPVDTPPSAKVAPEQPATSQVPVPVVPKGLRPFDRDDSEFFLQLLPGPRDRHGLPDSIRFWKTRIEGRNAESALAVGLIYGPSGCGKSSLIQAGLLPRLAPSVLRVYVEATREHLEVRIAKALHRAYPSLSAGASLPDMLAQIRRGRVLPDNAKLLIVLDQFEQWLHAHGHDMESTELVAALRQTDGEHVQVVLMVRDDFWMSISRLFDSLEINLDRAHNARAVDLFDADHARHVLRLFGQAFDRLPAEPAELTKDQADFLNRAVAELSQDGRVIPVRLSLFADLMKERSWTSATLVEVGGAEGVGVRFLEETFTARTALPDLRRMEKPARALLQALLPERGTDIKGQMRSRGELAAASGLAEEPARFDRLVELLDRELHIITPTEAEPERAAAGGQETSRGENAQDSASLPRAADDAQPGPHAFYYQLTHDYLVPALRQWLTQEKRKTWRGRAELCLEERTSQWGRVHERRYLPSAREYLAIALGVPRRKRNAEQRALMRAGAWLHGFRWGSVLAAILALILTTTQFLSSVRYQRTADQIQSLLAAAPEDFPSKIDKLRPDQDLATSLLRAHFEESTNSRHQLRAACALSALGEVKQEFLIDAVGRASAAECKNLVTALGPQKDAAAGQLLERALDPQASITLRVRYATVLLHLGDARAARRMLALAPDPAERTAFIHSFKSWHGDLGALANLLQPREEDAFLSGLCAALGLIEPDTLSDYEKEELEQVLSELYRVAPGSGTHSTSDWTLRQWKAGLPAAAGTTGQRWFINRLGMTMLKMDAGTFVMGDPDEQELRAHRVTLTRPFYISDRQVSVAQFQQFLKDPDYSSTAKPQGAGPNRKFSPAPDCPMQTVNWFDVLLFCNWLSLKEGLEACYERTGAKEKIMELGNPEPVDCEVWRWLTEKNGYRLSTEAEWEYACRAGTVTKYAFGDDASLLPSYSISRAMRTSPGGSRLPNAWGLFDMHGNVFEWCWDRYSVYDNSPATDPKGPAAGAMRLLRGGSYISPAQECRSASRVQAVYPTLRMSMYGFRVVCNAPKQAIN